MSEITVKITGFNTKEEAEQFILWYDGQGEQDIPFWLECRKDEGKIDVDTMNVDLEKTFPFKWNDNAVQMFIIPR